MADTEINIGGPAVYEQRKEEPFTSDSSKSLSPVQLAREGESAALTGEQVAATAPKAKYDTDVANINAADASTKEAIAGKTLVERDQVDERHAARIAASAEALRQANDALKAAPAPSLFADTKGWDTVKQAIGLALAGLGDAMAARAHARLGTAPGPSAVTNIINMDLDRQRANIAKLTNHQIMAKEGVKDAQQARDQALAKVELKGAAMLNAAALHTEAMLKAKGVELPAIQQNEQILKLKREEQDRRQAAVAGLAKEHTSTGAKTETTNRTVPDKASAKMGVVRNPDGGAAGTSPAGEANEVNEQTRLRVQADNDLKDLYEHVLAHPRVLAGTDEYKTRQELFAKAKIAVGSVSSLGKSDEALKTEMDALGPKGDGLQSGDASALKRLIKANEKNAHDAIKIHTSHPGAVGDDGLPAKPTTNPAPAVPAAGAPAAAAPATPPMVPPSARPARAPNSGFTPDQQEAVRWIAAHPTDSRVPAIKARLGLP